MKKLILSILFILCLSFQASALGPMVVLSGTSSSVTCTATAMACETDNDWLTLGTTASENYQEIKAQGAEITICQVDVKLYYDTTPGDVHIEVWNVAFDTKYGDSSTSQTINATTPGQVYNFVWSGTKPVVPNADFKLVILEEGGDIRIKDCTTETCYEDATYELVLKGVEKDVDAYFKIHTLQ